MSIGSDLQQLNSGESPYIELFEIQINETDFIYITNYIEGFGSGSPSAFNVLQFRDYDNPSTIRDYYPVPSQMDGIEHKSEGQFPQPSFTVANILRTSTGNDSFQALLGSVSYGDLLGLKVIRRRTLQKYLVGQPGDANPPVELPRDIFFLDRIENEDARSVTFTTVLPLDFTGVTLPKRNILGNRCPWKYQGAGYDLNEWEKVGGCTWRSNSNTSVGDISVPIYVNDDDEYILSSTTSFTSWTTGPSIKGRFYTTSQSNLTKIEEDGSLTTGQTGTNYWQALDVTSDDPADNSPDWRRVRVYTDFTGSPSVDVYVEDKYNDYFRVNNGGGNYTVWKASRRSQTLADTPEGGNFWERGDRCGKRLLSCKLRFQSNPWIKVSLTSTSGFNVGNVIRGRTSETTAKITRISGTTVYLDTAVGVFTNGETIENTSVSPVVTTTASSTTTAEPALGFKKENKAIPFGSFPTARVFQ
jgi:lambda family phage minor tail protein L